MPCICCLPKCCPAWRAYDGSNTFYRYATFYFWSTYDGGGPYTLTDEDDEYGPPAYVERRTDNLPGGNPAPRNRGVAGHKVVDAVAYDQFKCEGYSTDTLPSDGPFRAPGTYGQPGGPPGSGLYGSFKGGIPGSQPLPSRPWRFPQRYNYGSGGWGNLPDGYAPIYGDFLYDYNGAYPGGDWDQVNGIPQRDPRQPRSIRRVELTGEYPSPPSPYCYLNPNPLP